MPRRNVVFDKGRGWRVEDDRYRSLHLGPDRGASVGEYGPRESSEFSDSYYGPGDDYERRTGPAHGYTRDEPDPERPRDVAAGGGPQRAPAFPRGNRMYGEVYSYGELRPGQQSWADLGVSSTRTEERGSTGSFRGRGPKGYRRSDERLLEAICERLTDDHRIYASDISVAVNDGEVTLTGTVRDKQAKWRAEDIADSCTAVKGVDNRLRCSHRS
jgi:hypothetical protein